MCVTGLVILKINNTKTKVMEISTKSEELVTLGGTNIERGMSQVMCI